MRNLCIDMCLPVVLATLLNSSQPAKNTSSFTVHANLMFSPTGVYADPNTQFGVIAAGLANLADEDGPYITDANGTIMKAPLANSGAWTYFKDNFKPIGVPPTLDTKKFPLGGSQLDTAPLGALVAGFATSANPTTLADFPNGFQFVGRGGEIVSPDSGGYLFFAVNDINNTADNDGYFLAVVSRK